ncbi:MAG TPA: hypothetical protein VGC41_09345 [Kofleriaceae bacterium]
MGWFVQLVHQGGATMFWIIYLAAPALLAALVYLVKPQPWLRWIRLALLVLVLAAGAYGTFRNQRLVDDAVAGMAHEAPADIEMMREQGAIEAKRPIELAGVVAGVLAVLFLAGEIRRRSAAS